MKTPGLDLSITTRPNGFQLALDAAVREHGWEWGFNEVLHVGEDREHAERVIRTLMGLFPKSARQVRVSFTQVPPSGC